MYKIVEKYLSVLGKKEAFLIALFAINQWIERLGIFIPLIHSYLDDLIAVPATLGVTKFLMYFIHKYTYERLYQPFQIFIVVCMFSIYFEWYLPQKYSYHYRDYFDVVCYVLGGIGYYFFIQKKPTLVVGK